MRIREEKKKEEERKRPHGKMTKSSLWSAVTIAIFFFLCQEAPAGDTLASDARKCRRFFT